MEMVMLLEQVGATISAQPQAAQQARAIAPAQESLAQPITGSKAVQPAQATPNVDELRDAVKKIEQVITPAAQGLRFSIDEDTGTTVVKVIDTETMLVLRQIPTVEVMEISKALGRLQGLLVKERA
jgi:flagellar protein FlaG